jgi:urea transport system permease protein
VLIFIGLLAVFTIVITILSEGFGLGIVSTSFIKVLGKTLCLCLDRHRHGSGLGLLRHPVAWPFRVLRPRRLHDRHVADVRAHQGYRHCLAVGRGASGNEEEVSEAIGTQIFGVVGGAEIPVVWYFADSLIAAAWLLVVLVPGLLALVFGWLAFRSRVTGVYLSILTQAMTLALSLYLFQNDSGLGATTAFRACRTSPA